MRLLLLAFLVVAEGLLQTLQPGVWLPIASIIELTGGNEEKVRMPKRVEVAGTKFAVWQSSTTKMWSVVEDICPHRKAPLSQGRIAETGNLECPYHGWQFGINGSCTLIPQLDKKFEGNIPSGTSVSSLPIHITGDILFAYVPLPEEDADSSSYQKTYEKQKLPDEVLPLLQDVSSITSRVLPYSFDFLIENFMDPAHIPFAHHSLQGVRSDGSPIPTKNLYDLDDSSKVGISFDDVVRGKPRTNAKVEFMPPCYFTLTVNERVGLLILCVPVKAGQSRVFVSPSPGRKLPSFIPKWFVHSFVNSFVDTDIWIADQERYIRKPRNSYLDSPLGSSNEYGKFDYVMPTSSDTGCRIWRVWFDKHLSKSKVFGASPGSKLSWDKTTEQEIDRWESHTKNCECCRNALENAEKIDKFSILLALIPLAVTPSKYTRSAGILMFLAAKFFSDKVIRATKGPSRGERTSAAQFPSKKSFGVKSLQTNSK